MKFTMTLTYAMICEIINDYLEKQGYKVEPSEDCNLIPNDAYFEAEVKLTRYDT